MMKKVFRNVILLLLLMVLPCVFSVSCYAQGWQWGKGSTGGENDAWPVATDASGNIFVAGNSQDAASCTFGGITVTNPSSAPLQDVIAKLDPSGNVLWMNATQGSEAWLFSIATDPSGNSIMFGSFDGPSMQIGSITLTNSTGLTQYFIAKYSPTGSVLWAINDGQASLGGQFVCTSALILGTGAVATDAAGNVYVTSNFTSATITIGPYTLTNADPSGTTDDIFIAKYNASGVLQWVTSIGGDLGDDAYGMTVTPAGNVYITGAFSSPSMSAGSSVITNTSIAEQAFIAEINPAGNPVWGEAATGAVDGTFGAGLASDAAGNVYMTGGFLDNSVSFGAVTVNSVYSSTGVLSLYLLQFSPSNVVTWSKTIGSATANVFGFSIALASCGQIWVSGNFNDSANIDGNILYPVANSGDPIFIAGYNLSGGVVGYSALQSGSDDQNGIACDASGNVFMCSDYLTTFLPFFVGPDSLLADGSGATELMYVAKFENTIVTDTVRLNTDTSLCTTGSIILAPPLSYTGPFVWSNGSTGSSLSVDSSGIYWVKCPGSCGASYLFDTFHVFINNLDTLHQAKDTSICSGNSIMLQAPPGYAVYQWNAGSSGSSISVSSTGTFWVACFDSCAMPPIIDTFHVNLSQRDSVYEHTDTTLCVGLGLSLTAPSGYLAYQWNNGSTATSIAAPTSGIYWVACIDSCVLPYLVDTFHVTFDSLNLSFSLGNDTFACSPVLLKVPETGVTYLWQNGSTQQEYTAITTGTYYATVSELGCQYTDSINVTIDYVNEQSFDTNVCLDNQFNITLNAYVPAGNSIRWSTGSRESSIQVVDTGTYYAYVSDSACTVTDTMQITGEYCECWCVVANAFTPGGSDPKTNKFKPFIQPTCTPNNYTFSIFDRWGKLVFSTNDPTISWDGTYNGVPAELDVYMYEVTFWGGAQNKKFFRKGDVTLIR